jgi:phosphoglycolate phosphatase
VIKGIIFDKDGTLIDFHALWDGVGENLAADFLERAGLRRDVGLETELTRAIGVYPGRVDPSGVFAGGTFDECGAVFARILARRGIGLTEREIAPLLRGISDAAVCSDSARYVEVCGLAELFGHLRRLGIRLGLVTCDTQAAADYAADRLALRGYLDFIEGAPSPLGLPKPHRDPADRFRAISGIRHDELAIVGDSMTDMLFAKNAGAAAIGVLSGVCAESELRRATDVVIPNIGHILQLTINS